MPTGSSNESVLTARDFEDIIGGNAAKIRLLFGVPQPVLLDISKRVRDLRLRKQAVLRVLGDLRTGRLGQSDAGEWASFVMHGYVRGHVGRLTVVDIPYEETDDEIAQVILRLEQIGDGIGERVSDQEVEGFIRLLLRTNRSPLG
jgi:hypothetical protein